MKRAEREFTSLSQAGEAPVGESAAVELSFRREGGLRLSGVCLKLLALIGPRLRRLAEHCLFITSLGAYSMN